MSADWRNEQAILRDLAIAQGNVPVDNVETVSSNEKPPSLYIQEETEEQFLHQYIADSKTNVTPDLDLLQEILEEVRNVRVNEIDDVVDSETQKMTEAHKCLPQKSTKAEGNKIKHRNAVLESLLGSEQTKKEKRNAVPIVVPPANMFKSKTSKQQPTPRVSENVVNVKTSGPGVFVPSSNAQEYYEKAVEKKRQKELAEENIWTRAERQRREIEAKRKQTNIIK